MLVVVWFSRPDSYWMQALSEDESEQMKKAATCSLGIAILSALCQSPSLASAKDMIARVPVLVKVSNSQVSRLFAEAMIFVIQEHAMHCVIGIVELIRCPTFVYVIGERIYSKHFVSISTPVDRSLQAREQLHYWAWLATIRWGYEQSFERQQHLLPGL